MKKILFLLPILLLTASANASDFCVKKTTYAVSAQGICEKFSTTCSVPDDSKVVPRCDIVENTDGSRPEDVLERRRQRQAAAYAARRAATEASQSSTTTRRMNYSGRRIGAGALTRNRTTRAKVSAEDIAARSRTRTSTYRRGASSAYTKVLHKDRNQTSTKQVGRTRGTISAVDRSFREGKLSNGQKFSDETHFSERSDSSSAWKSALQRRNYITSGRRIERKRTPRTVTLRRYYRGGTEGRAERMNAGVSDSGLDE